MVSFVCEDNLIAFVGDEDTIEHHLNVKSQHVVQARDPKAGFSLAGKKVGGATLASK
jgi:hypothetical protein